MRVLVLGGSQFIGQAIVDELLHQQYDVTVLNRCTAPLGIARVTEVVADRRDAAQVSAVVTDDVDAVVEQLLAQAFGERLLTLRPSYVFGPRNNLEREQFVWARLLGGQPIFVPGREETRIQFTCQGAC